MLCGGLVWSSYERFCEEGFYDYTCLLVKEERQVTVEFSLVLHIGSVHFDVVCVSESAGVAVVDGFRFVYRPGKI